VSLLLQITDMRISKYAKWTVDDESLDSAVLGLLCRKLSSPGADKAVIGRRFGQLYSYAIQRYIKGQDFLSDTDRQRLVSVLVETERSCISRLLVPQSFIRKAVEQDDYTALLREHDRLLGDETKAGQLQLKLDFDYGQTGDGAKRTAPVTLPNPPKPKSGT